MVQVSVKNVLLFSIAMSLLLLLGCGNGDEQTEKYVAPEPEPEILDMPSQKMAVIYTKGDPSVVAGREVPAIFASVTPLASSSVVPTPLAMIPNCGFPFWPVALVSVNWLVSTVNVRLTYVVPVLYARNPAAAGKVDPVTVVLFSMDVPAESHPRYVFATG